METTRVRGATIERGAQDWQIFQRRPDGTASIALAGRWTIDVPFTRAAVLVRVMREDEMEPVSPAFNYTPAETRDDGTWSAVLSGVPSGGLYRIETSLQIDGGPVEWSVRGDMVHHVGVGDVWVIAGQSNAAGYGKSPARDEPELGVHMFHARGRWALASHPLGDSTGTRYPLNRENANASHSPYLAFGRKLKRALGRPIGLIPASLGGSPISRWVRGVDGDLFSQMLDYIRDAGGACRGMVWYQGCSDTGPEARAVYYERFRAMVEDFRRTMKDGSLPVLTCQLNRYSSPRATADLDAGWDGIREIQRAAARTVPGVFVVSTLDLALSDGIHNNSAANLAIGARLADTALGGVYGAGVKHLHPDIAAARRSGAKSIDLVFDNVDTRLNWEDGEPSRIPFAVRDDAGPVGIAGCAIPEKNVVRLTLGREPEGTAVVTGAPGVHPPGILPVDICGFRPMLAFTVPVSEK